VIATLSFYNTATRRIEPFDPPSDPIRMYVCGPTVYDHAHLGHARTYVFFDVVRRVLEFRGRQTLHIQNFTDAAEEIGTQARARGLPPAEVADGWIREFLADMDALDVQRAHHYPRVTESISRMVALLEDLRDRGLAYTVGGSTYLDTARAGGMGRVSGWKLSEVVQDVQAPPSDRQRPEDFVLWRCDDSRGQTWESPFGRGRPGWHVECVAMAMSHAPGGLDLHGGGMDLKLPHHDSEAAVGEALLGRPLARAWLHSGFVTVWQQKMSKSAGNFVRVRDLLPRHEASAIRLFLLSEHYPDSLDYTPERLSEAGALLAEIRAAVDACRCCLAKPARREQALAGSRQAFFEAVADDLDTRHAIVHLRDASRHVNRLCRHDLLDGATARAMLDFYGSVERVLGLRLGASGPIAPAR